MGRFNKGDTVYNINAWGTLCEGVIIGEKDGYYMLEGTGKHSKVLEDFQYTYGSYGAKTADCYATKEECLEAERERSGAALKEYLDEITDMESLVLFMYGHEFHSGEYCDGEACAAVEQKMQEFGIKT